MIAAVIGAIDELALADVVTAALETFAAALDGNDMLVATEDDTVAKEDALLEFNDGVELVTVAAEDTGLELAAGTELGFTLLDPPPPPPQAVTKPEMATARKSLDGNLPIDLIRVLFVIVNFRHTKP